MLSNPLLPPLEHSTVKLLCNGEQFFSALCAALDAACTSIYLETYIFADDATGHLIKGALIRAAQRGVKVYIVIDGFGSGAYGRTLVNQLKVTGVQARTYRPQRWWQWSVFLSPVLLRRLHRKLCVVDERLAFVGGINIIDDHNHSPHKATGLGPRFDFACHIEGDLVAHVSKACKVLHKQAVPTHYDIKLAWSQNASFIARDNVRNLRIIEKTYLKLLASAQEDVWLANAYFLPGRRFRKALLACRKRGVAVHILLQGHVEYPIQHRATLALYGQLIVAGVHIYEYSASFLHAKVAVIDGQRATVGSSNIDPFSLHLAQEANVLVNDADFSQLLRAALQHACKSQATHVGVLLKRSIWQRSLDWCAYSLVRLGISMIARR